jgi:hypothetical protein
LATSGFALGQWAQARLVWAQDSRALRELVQGQAQGQAQGQVQGQVQVVMEVCGE